MNDIGKHVLADLYGVDPALLADEQALMTLLWSALARAHFTIIDQLSFTFSGGGAGVTGVFLLSESHAAFHTYPEIPFMALDIFSCGTSDPELVLAQIVEAIQPDMITTTIERRGKDNRSKVAMPYACELAYEAG